MNEERDEGREDGRKEGRILITKNSPVIEKSRRCETKIISHQRTMFVFQMCFEINVLHTPKWVKLSFSFRFLKVDLMFDLKT